MSSERYKIYEPLLAPIPTRSNQKTKVQKMRQAKRYSLPAINSNESSAFREARLRKVNQRIDINNLSITGQGATGFLTLPPEIRHQIYSILFANRSEYDMVDIVASQPPIRHCEAKLHQICRFLRDEVDQYFWTNEYFFFRSGAALDLWTVKHRDRLRLMSSIKIYAWHLPLIKANKSCFRNLKFLILIQPETLEPDLGVMNFQEWSFGQIAGCHWQEYNHNLAETRDDFCPSSTSLLSWRNVEVVVRNFPQFRQGQVMQFESYSPAEHHSVRFTTAARSVKVTPENSWRLIKIDLVGRNLNLAVRRISKGARSMNMPINTQDFCRIQLGRSI